LPPFENRFPIVVAKNIAKRKEVQGDVILISTPPLDIAIAYHSMYAFGNHLQVASAKLHLSTLDLRVAATFEQECCSHSNDENPIMASL
jgi:hypothetical protein